MKIRSEWLIYKTAISQNAAERPNNITSILKKSKSSIKYFYQKRCTENITRFKRKVRKPTYTQTKKSDWLLVVGNIYFFPKSKFVHKYIFEKISGSFW